MYDDPARLPRVRVLVGMGGCGKTTVARELVRHAVRTGGPAWWISAATADLLTDGMRALAVYLGADPGVLAHSSLPDLLWRHLTMQTTPWLLVLDNADDPDHVLGPPGGAITDANGWLRPTPASGMLVVTSRDRTAVTWATDWIISHHITNLLAADGAQILTELAGSAAGTPADAAHLTARLGGLPLALRTAGAYLRNAAMIPPWSTGPDTIHTFTEYTTTLDTAPAAPGSEATLLALVNDTWERSLDLLKSRDMPQARPLLRLLACFADAPVPGRLIAEPGILADAPGLAGLTNTQIWQLLQ
ncbi:hypothetical protein ACFO1B_57065, partial [Dactylosporangium siamense]